MSTQSGGRLQVGIVVGDLAPMVEFYEKVLGLEPADQVDLPGGRMVRLVHGDAGVKLVEFDRRPADANPPGGMATARGLRYLTVVLPDVPATFARCEAAGCAVARPLFEWQGKPIAIVEDPEGNWVELMGPPPGDG